MAKPVSEEELQLKKRARRRLIGAVVLVAVVAAVLPMALDSEPKNTATSTTQDVNIQIPSPEAKGGFPAKAVPPTAPTEKAAAGKAERTPEDKAEAKEPATPPVSTTTEAPKVAAPVIDKAAEKAPVKSIEKVPEKAPEKAAVAKSKGTFFIQVIALAEADKARQVQQQIVDAGIHAYTEVVAAGKGNVTRVRAGPFATREEAERARAKLATVGLEGKVAAQ